jgi:plasmid stabilization system protein ParE
VGQVRLTANFEANLESIRSFLTTIEAAPAFDELIEDLFGTWIPNLETFPHIGRDFARIPPQSVEGAARHARMLELAEPGTEIREYIAGDYLVLYAVRRSTVYLLSIRHHRQLSFDLREHWR